MAEIPDQATYKNIYETGGAIVAPNVRNWASEIDPKTIDQAVNSAKLPILAGPVALMPDAHFGYGLTVGSVIATEGAIVPSAVGVDIGCGMIAMKTDLVASDLPDDLEPMLKDIYKNVPAGVGMAHGASTGYAFRWFAKYGMPDYFDAKQSEKALTQFGTLGSGNHFAEVSLDEDEGVWLVLHSGSRGIGNTIATAHIKKAGKEFSQYVEDYKLEDPDLAWLVQGTQPFKEYTDDLMWLQDYALGNREAMAHAMALICFHHVGKGEVLDTIQAHHNYATLEEHVIDEEVKKLWITRKGAIRAFAGDRGIIPGSMGTDTFIVEGLGNPLSWMSCSHGAGRRMSRNQAKKTLTTDSLKTAMKGRTWLRNDATHLLDEHPDAYKSIDDVMADQTDLIRPLHRLRAVLNYKG